MNLVFIYFLQGGDVVFFISGKYIPLCSTLLDITPIDFGVTNINTYIAKKGLSFEVFGGKERKGKKEGEGKRENGKGEGERRRGKRGKGEGGREKEKKKKGTEEKLLANYGITDTTLLLCPLVSDVT